MNVTHFNRSKGLLLGLLTFCICAAIAIFLPHLFHRPSNTVFFFSGIIFIVFPLIISLYISKRCLTPAQLTFDEFGLYLQRTRAEYSLVIHWQDVISFRMQPFKILFGNGIRLKIYYNNRKSLTLYFFGIDLLSETTDEQPFIPAFFQSVNKYNLQVAPDKKVMLLPGFFATESGRYLMCIPALLVVFDLYYRAAHPLESRKGIMFFFFAIAMAAGFWGQVLKERKSFEKLSDMQNQN